MSTVQGSVRDSVTKALIPRAVVTAPPYTVANINGTYSFTTPGATTVNVTASATGYTPQTATISVPSIGTVIKNFLLVKTSLAKKAGKTAPAKAKAKAKKVAPAKTKARKPAQKAMKAQKRR
jgi:hypothetical protein